MAKLDNGKLSKFRPLQANPNKHTQRGLGLLQQSMQEDGWVAPITVEADGESLDGAARMEVAADKFGDDVIVVEHDGTRPVIMVRVDIANAEMPIAKRIAYRANRVAQVDLAWDANQIAADMEAGLDLTGMFYDNELAAILEQAADGILATPYTDQFDKENAELDGAEDVTIQVVVPAMHAEMVTGWLANGESKTGPGIGRGVLKRCGLL